MKEWFSEYGYLVGIFALVLILFFFIFKKAVQAYSNHNRTYKKQEAELRRLVEIKEKFKDFTAQSLENIEREEILEGVALTYQIVLQKKDDMEVAFRSLEENQQNIYVLDVFVNDGGVKTFFGENTDILRKKFIPALDMIDFGEGRAELKKAADMYNLDCEDVSWSEKELEKIDNFIIENDILRKIKLKSAEYIINNADSLKCNI